MIKGKVISKEFRSIMKQHYIDLFNLNRDLISGYRIRCTNHEELMKNLRFINQTVQKAGNLRSKLFKIRI